MGWIVSVVLHGLLLIAATLTVAREYVGVVGHPDFTCTVQEGAPGLFPAERASELRLWSEPVSEEGAGIPIDVPESRVAVASKRGPCDCCCEENPRECCWEGSTRRPRNPILVSVRSVLLKKQFDALRHVH